MVHFFSLNAVLFKGLSDQKRFLFVDLTKSFQLIKYSENEH